MTRGRHRGRPACVALLGGLLAAASCLGPRADPSTFFVLSARAEPPASAEPLPAVLGLGPLTLPGYLDRAQLATRIGEHRLAYAETERWAEPLADNVARVLEANLLRLLLPTAVVRHPWYASEGVDFAVAMDFTRLEAEAGSPVVTVEATWRITEVGTGDTVRRSSSLVREERAGEGTEASVAALSRALARVSEDIARAVRAAAAGR